LISLPVINPGIRVVIVQKRSPQVRQPIDQIESLPSPEQLASYATGVIATLVASAACTS
jgi:hypothetical protein